MQCFHKLQTGRLACNTWAATCGILSNMTSACIRLLTVIAFIQTHMNHSPFLMCLFSSHRIEFDFLIIIPGQVHAESENSRTGVGYRRWFRKASTQDTKWDIQSRGETAEVERSLFVCLLVRTSVDSWQKYVVFPSHAVNLDGALENPVSTSSCESLSYHYHPDGLYE